MIRIAGITLPLEHDNAALGRAAAGRLRVDLKALRGLRLFRKSVDARHKGRIALVYTVDVALESDAAEDAALDALAHDADVRPAPDMRYTPPQAAPRSDGPPPVVVGAGPCGLFAALLLAELGLRPILLERGKPAAERIQDVYAFWRTGALDPASNALFGEGGAGTFSDGKLTTQIKDRGNRCRKVLEELAAAGAPEAILYEQKPHIGTDKLVRVVAALREKIIRLGGEVRFGAHVAGIAVRDGAAAGLELADGSRLDAHAVVLATGHSARDTFAMLDARGVPLQPKPFSIGVRIEHPQALIDRAQYGPSAGHPALGAADYKLVHHCRNGRSVYTFCMCPGGEVIAAATEAGGVVTNGMSAWSRAKPNANAAVLAGVAPEDFGGDGPLAGVAFQRRWEEAAYQLGGGGFRAPAQRLEDFLEGRASNRFGDVAPSYMPGAAPADLADCLPGYAVDALREALPAFDRKLRGYALPDAVLTGVETRSSSPVRIPRGKGLESLGVRGLYPAGEGAGYAGGIVSAAVDGLRAAEALCAAG